jgi:transposase
MEVLHRCCAGLDVHQKSVVACVRIQRDGRAEHEVRTFGTLTRELEELSAWLTARGCTHVAMEATGVFWKPVWYVLEPAFELVLANAGHIRNVPGRKTDVNDATWISDLLAHGLITASFVPDTTIQQMRTLTRTRKQLVRERAKHVQRLHKILETANVKIGSVVSDLMGFSGRAILEALAAGESDPARLIDRTTGRLRASREHLEEAVRGYVTDHHRFMLRLHLDQIDGLDRAIAKVDEEVDRVVEPFRICVEQLTSIPGVSDVVAQVIVSEIGTDMSRFPTAGHLRSWAGLCPRNDESAGKRRSTRLRKGGNWLKTTLVQAAWSAARKKDSYLQAQFLRLKSRRGPKKAVIAVAASILTAAYHMLQEGTFYEDPGANYFTHRDRERSKNRLVQRLANLGYEVEIREVA